MQAQIYSFPSLLAQTTDPSITISGHRMIGTSTSKRNTPPPVFGTHLQLTEEDAQGCRLARIMRFSTQKTDTAPVISRGQLPPQPPSVPYRIDRKIAEGAHLPVIANPSVTSPPMPKGKSDIMDIHSPKPIRSFQTAAFTLSQSVSAGEEDYFNAFLPKSEFSQLASQVIPPAPRSPPLTCEPSPIPLTLSLSLPAWPSSSLSFSVPALAIYPETSLSSGLTSNFGDSLSQRLFGYLCLTAPRPVAPSTNNTDRTWRFDPFGDSNCAHNIPSSSNDIPRRKDCCPTPDSIDLCTFASCASTFSEGESMSFYSMSSGSGSERHSDSLCPSPSYSTPPSSTRCSSVQSPGLNDSTMEEEGLFREAVHISSIVLSLDERKEGMNEVEWRAEMRSVLALWKAMYAKTCASDKRLDLRGPHASARLG